MIEKLWKHIAPVVTDEGLELYDIEIVSHNGGVIRVFITKPKDKTESTDSKEVRSGVQLKDISRVAKRVNHILDVDLELSESYAVEVSSPGITRRLRRTAHFAGAIGESVKVSVAPFSKVVEREGDSSFKGILEQFEDGVLSVRVDNPAAKSHGVLVAIPEHEVKKAMIEFNFDSLMDNSMSMNGDKS